MSALTVKDRIKSLCSINGIGLATLDRTLGFGNGTIGGWDKSSPSADKLLKVARYFNVSVDSLLGYSVSSAPAPALSPDALAVALAYEAADPLDKELACRCLHLELKKRQSPPALAEGPPL